MSNNKQGKRLKRLRELAGVSQAELANHLGCDRAYLSMVEGSYRKLSADDMAKAEEFISHTHARRLTEFTELAAVGA